MPRRLFVATRKGLFRFERRSFGGWRSRRVQVLGDPVSIVLPDLRSGTLYAALDLGHFGVKMHRSRDGGEHFEACAAPSFPGAEPARTPESAHEAPSVELVWSLAAGGADQGDLLWAGTIPGGLFRSRDGADSWELVESLWNRPERKAWTGGGFDHPGIHSICVDPRDPRHVTVGISIGGVWVTRDGGETWSCQGKGMRGDYLPPELRFDPNLQDPHRLVQCPADPDVFWAQHHNGVYLSRDGAASWTEIENVPPSVFGFALAVHPKRPDTAWLVPAIKDECRVPVNARMVVARTTNAGKRFRILRDGLPDEPAYDLVYRHGLTVDARGKRLALGSTTGGLWVSDNGGNNWECLSTHLPPIYCVCFEG